EEFFLDGDRSPGGHGRPKTLAPIERVLEAEVPARLTATEQPGNHNAAGGQPADGGRRRRGGRPPPGGYDPSLHPDEGREGRSARRPAVAGGEKDRVATILRQADRVENEHHQRGER